MGPPLTPNFEAGIFAAAAIPLRDVGKISLGPPLTQILDPHLRCVHNFTNSLNLHTVNPMIPAHPFFVYIKELAIKKT